MRAALTVAALDKGGNASQVAQRMAQEGVTAEGIQELKAAADLDVQDANVTAQMQQTVQENQVALRTAQLIGDGALKAVQPYETAVAQAKSVLRQAQGELRRQVKRREGLGQNLLSLQEQINSGTATPQLLDTFRSTVKDIEGQIKVVNEYTQRVTNAEQSLHDAQNQLDTVRDETLRQVRQQAQQDVADMQAQQLAEQEAAKAEQAQQAEAQEKTGYQKKQFIPYDGPVPQTVDNVQQETVTIDDANYAQVQRIVEEAQAEAETKAGVRGLVRSALRDLFGNLLDKKKVTLDNVQFDGQPYTVTIFKSLINKVVSDPKMTTEKLSVLGSMEKVLQKAVYEKSSDVDRSQQQKDYVVRYDYLSSMVNVAGTDYKADLIVEVYNPLNKLKTYLLRDIEMTPAASPYATGPVPALAENGQNPVQYRLRTGPLDSVASSNSILASDAENVNTENISNLESLNDANVPPATPTQDNADAQNDSGEKYRQFGTQTAQSTDALFQETRDYLLHNSVYEADSNTEQIDRAIDWVRGQATSHDPAGYFTARSAVLDPSFDYASADGQARMLTVMQMSTLMGDTQGQVQIADIFNRQGTALAQALQARKIFYMISPAAQAASIQKIANNLSQENGVTVTVPQDTLNRLSQAKTMDEAQKIRNQIVREMYQQLPANWKSRLNGLRYFSMLANPRTHIRNILGNTIMQGTVAFGWPHFPTYINRCIPPHPSRCRSTLSPDGEGFHSYAL